MHIQATGPECGSSKWRKMRTSLPTGRQLMALGTAGTEIGLSACNWKQEQSEVQSSSCKACELPDHDWLGLKMLTRINREQRLQYGKTTVYWKEEKDNTKEEKHQHVVTTRSLWLVAQKKPKLKHQRGNHCSHTRVVTKTLNNILNIQGRKHSNN